MLKPFTPRSTSDPRFPKDEPQDPASPAVAHKRESRSALWELVETLLLALIIFVAVRSVVLNYRVDGSSMETSLQNGEMLIVNRREYFHIDLNKLIDWIPGVTTSGTREWYPFRPPQRGDIIVFTPPGESPDSEPYIKRIIGLPGDQVSIRDGGVYINGQRLNEPYALGPTMYRGFAASQDFVVPRGDVFVLGDNRNNSSDSRVFGPVPISNIIGKAWIAYWPPSAIQVLPHPNYNVSPS